MNMITPNKMEFLQHSDKNTYQIFWIRLPLREKHLKFQLDLEYNPEYVLTNASMQLSIKNNTIWTKILNQG